MPTHVRPRRRRKAGPFSIIVGVIGELLITLGVFLGLFVVWQLWWTDIIAGNAHAATVQALADEGWKASPPKVASEHTDDPPVEAEPAFGTTFATYYVPRFGTGYEEPITEGVKKKQILDVYGIGHYPDTQMPGAYGNFAIAGHRTTYGKPFTKIADLKEGDALVVRTKTTWYVYKVTSHQIVYPKDYDVVSKTPNTPFATSPTPDKRYITMTACHPMFSASQRYVVHGEMAYWAPVSEGTPKELLDAGVKVTVGGATANAMGAR